MVESNFTLTYEFCTKVLILRHFLLSLEHNSNGKLTFYSTNVYLTGEVIYRLPFCFIVSIENTRSLLDQCDVSQPLCRFTHKAEISENTWKRIKSCLFFSRPRWLRLKGPVALADSQTSFISTSYGSEMLLYRCAPVLTMIDWIPLLLKTHILLIILPGRMYGFYS